ncbi:LicD family protein [Porticoccaceae bacterium]|jgi:hypothetical protein|nr:LicD family protein [Porticoccaceae bacterium]
MKSSLNYASLETALTKMVTELRGNNIEFFAFFGTLLGLIREGKPIETDDDVDFYVNVSDYENVKSVLRCLNFEIDYTMIPNHTKCFIQATGFLMEEFVRIDFYFFDKDVDPHFLIERWNFPGTPQNPKSILKVPKPLIFPLREISFGDVSIPIPKYPEIICEFLYGVNWTTPQQKKTDYHTLMLGGRPIRYRKDNGSIKLID